MDNERLRELLYVCEPCQQGWHLSRHAKHDAACMCWCRQHVKHRSEPRERKRPA